MNNNHLPLPTQSTLITVTLVVEDPARSRDFYAGILGGTVVRAHAPAMVRLANTWIIIRPGPVQARSYSMMTLTGNVYANPMALSIQVEDIRAVFEMVSARGGEFVTPLLDLGDELRCYMRDPDGYLIEFGEILATSSLPCHN